MDSHTESSTSRPLATHNPIAAPQDLVKLGKVQKVTRTRINKAKQGRPQHLSISQKRKLVRLYIYTNLSLDAIRQLIEHFGTRKIQRRTLQKHLRDLFLDRYNMLRPGSADASHERTLQVLLCKTSRNRRHSIQGALELETPSPYPFINFDDDISGQSVMDMNGMLVKELIESRTPENPSENHISIDHMEGSIDTNHHSLDWGFGSTSTILTAELSYLWTPHDVQEFPLSSDQLFPPVQPVLLTSADPFMGTTGNNSLEYLLPRPKEIEAGAPAETATELYLANDDDAAATKLSLDSGIGSHSGTTNTGESALIPLAPQPLELLTTDLTSRPTPRSSQSDKGNNDTNPYEDNHITIHDSGLKQSDLKALIHRNTKSSGKERDIIEQLITTFSISTGSISTPSTLTIRSTSGLPTGHVSNQLLRSGFSKHRYTQPPASALSQLTRSYWFINDPHPQSSFVLPGNHNHIEGYLVSGSSGSISEQKQWVSQPLHCNDCLLFLFKVLPGGSHFWYNQDVGWSDEYGNTSLHAAAALGACFNILAEIIRFGVDVKRTNTAGQTFLHVLRRQDLIREHNWTYGIPGQDFLDSLRRHDLKEWSKLVTELKERNYNFNHHDVFGRTIWNLVSQDWMNELSIMLQTLGITADFRWVESRLINHIRSSSNSDTIKGLLHEENNVNERDDIGRTPLHLSIREGLTEITSTLLGFQPNLHAREIRGKGVLAVGESALRLAKSDPSLYAKITACMTLAIDAGAIAEPTSHHEWRLPNYQHWPGDPTQLDDYLQGSCAGPQMYKAEEPKEPNLEADFLNPSMTNLS